MSRLHIQLIAGALVVSLAGCSSGGGSTPGGGATPQAVFENLKAAAKSKDYKTAFAQTTPESQEMLIALIAIPMQMMAMMAPEKASEAKQILDKHGVKSFDNAQPPADAKDPKSLFKEVAANVADKPACIAEMITWNTKNMAGSGGAPSPADEFVDATLEEVKVDGDKATGKVKAKAAAGERQQDIQFKKIGDLWFVDFAGLIPDAGMGGAMPGGRMPKGDFVPTGPPAGFNLPGQK